ncbi:tyrosine-type recombinase/integrase [Dokdonia sp. Asnod2-E02]|uniref:tyrosine-type recombinase/integrase n=1 Tax=Dokdonia sp. Asnod2-E02 TaxID=3160574 RepID=UPI0038661F95
MTSVKILLRKATNKKYRPIIMRVIKNRKTKTINLGFDCLEKDWNDKNLKFKKSYPNYRQRNLLLLKYLEKAEKIIDDFHQDDVDFTLDQFEEKFRGREVDTYTVSEFWLEKIAELISVGRTGRARAYKGTYSSFYKFNDNSEILFKEIDLNLLNKYEIFLRSNGGSDGGIGVRMRDIRALFNEAISKGIVKEKYYPFKAYKISKLKSQNTKIALSREEFRKIEDVDISEHLHLYDSKNYLIFSYYTGGMNFHDLMKLKWSNIQEERITYKRSKTKGNFSIPKLEPISKILEHYKNQERTSTYVFPILLSDDLTPPQIENRKAKTLKKFNKQLKELASLAKINKKVTSYTIRHSFATNLKYAGVSTDIISELMGHTDIKVTQSYLKDFGSQITDKAVRKLLEEPRVRYAS